MTEQELREQLATLGKSLFDRGYTCGSSGNISVRHDDGMLITPTNSCLGRLDPGRISKVDWDGNVLAGDKPSKEAPLHLAMYAARPGDGSVVHLHSTWAVAASCLADVDRADVLPAATPYYIMRVGRLPLVPFFPPGDDRLADHIASLAKECRAILLANHGPIIAAHDLDTAVTAAEELEENAKLFFILRDQQANFLTPEQRDEVQRRFPNR
jgi:3-dehydro-4-phosphotetronate decarboxylase